MRDEPNDVPAALGEVLLYRTLDWVDPGMVFQILRPIVPDKALRALVMRGLVCHVLLEGLMVPGDVGDEFEPWPGTPTDWLVRIISELADYDEVDLMPGDVVWLKNTSLGDELVAAYRESRPPEF